MVGAAGDFDLGEQAVLLLIAAANALQSAGNVTGENQVAGMQPRDFLELCDRITGIAFKTDLADHGPWTGYDMEGQVDLVLLLVTLLGIGHRRLVESIFLHHSLDACLGPVEFFPRVEFTELQTGRADQLVGGRVAGNAFHGDHAHEKIGDRQKAQANAGSVGAIGFGLNIGEAPGGKKGLHGIVQVFASENFANPERRGGEQRSRFLRRNSRQLDSIDGQAEIGGDGSEVGGRFGG